MYGVYLKCNFCRRKHKVVTAKSRNLEPVDTSRYQKHFTVSSVFSLVLSKPIQ